METFGRKIIMRIQLHTYVIIATGVLLFFMVSYGFWYDHRESINADTQWVASLKKANVPDAVIDDIEHDGDTWYYNGKSLCVGYGDWNDECKRYEHFCAGDKIIGNSDEQASAIAVALRNGGVHPECPLMYNGAN